MDTFWLVVVSLWLLCAIGAYLIATQRGDLSPIVWGGLGLTLGPVGLAATLLMAKAPAPGYVPVVRETRTATIVMVVIVVATVVAAVVFVGGAMLLAR